MPTDESAKEFVKRTTKPIKDELRADEIRKSQDLQRKAKDTASAFLSNPAQKGVFFYPRFGMDYLQPLHEFAHACQTFIFCDWGFANGGNREEATFTQWFKDLQEHCRNRAIIHRWIATTRLDDAQVQRLTNTDSLVAHFFPNRRPAIPPALQEYRNAPNPARAIHANLLVNGSDGDQHDIQVFFIAAEAVGLYWNLYMQKKKAPEYLCVKRWWNINEWTQLNAWNAHLGQVLELSGRYPAYLIDWALQPGWPYAHPVPIFGWVNPHNNMPANMWMRNGEP
jgi:hypothetical protein